VQVRRWYPRTYKQVWLFAVLGFGVPGFIIWAVVEQQHSLMQALIYAVSVTFFGGLGPSRRLRRRKRASRWVA
jgi:hypothetical protein